MRRAISSGIGGEGDAAVEAEAETDLDAATDTTEGVGAAEGVAGALFFMAAILAAISALFWAMRASADCCCHASVEKGRVTQNVGSAHCRT